MTKKVFINENQDINVEVSTDKKRITVYINQKPYTFGWMDHGWFEDREMEFLLKSLRIKIGIVIGRYNKNLPVGNDLLFKLLKEEKDNGKD